MLTAIAIALTVPAAAALLVLVGLTASLTAADDDLLKKIGNRQDWDNRVTDLRAAINSAWSVDRAEAALSRPALC